jgi:hypothetical protein
MSNKNWRDHAELIGIAAIVASLVFVGLQLKQSQDIAIAAQYQQRYAVAMDYWIAKEQNDWYIQATGQNESNQHPEIASEWPDATPDDVGRLLLIGHQVIKMFDNQHYQFESGFMTDEGWLAQKENFKSIVVEHWFHHMMQEHKELFRPSFLEFCFQLSAEALGEE